MGDINTNIRIDNLETVVENLYDKVDNYNVPGFFKLPDMEHNETIDADVFNAIKSAIDSGKIILTGKLTRTSAWAEKFSENVPVIATYEVKSGDAVVELDLITSCECLEPSPSTNRTNVLCKIKIYYITDTVIRTSILPQYPS